MKNVHSKKAYLVFILFLTLLILLPGCGGEIGGGRWDREPTLVISSFSFYDYPAATTSINQSAKTIEVTVPYQTDVTKLIAEFTTTGDSVNVGDSIQRSGETVNNFTIPLSYTATWINGEEVTYTVSVVEAEDSAKEITAFSFVGYSKGTGTINESTKTITVTVPLYTDVTNLIANFKTTGSKVEVASVVQKSRQTVNDFTNPVDYTVTAANGTKSTYTVYVTAAKGSTGTYTIDITVRQSLNSSKAISAFPLVEYTNNYGIIDESANAISAFTFAGYTNIYGIIDESAKTINVTLPYGTDITDLIANFTSTGTRVEVDVTEQTSGATVNDFTHPVNYYVIAADTTETKYVVTVTLADPNPIAPELGETERFVMLASQKINTTAGSVLNNGDIGILNQPRINFEGFTEIEAGYIKELTNGYTYAQDDFSPDYVTPDGYADTAAFINQVRIDLETADTFLAESDSNELASVCPSQLGNLTLTRGIYKAANNVLLTTGDLTLDAQGDPDAVFIFSIYGTFSTGASGGDIILKNGAQAKNVYFWAYDSVIIGSDTIFHGNVFAPQLFVHKHADITGRLFAVENEVDLISNTVTKAP